MVTVVGQQFWAISTKDFTVGVCTSNGIIHDCPPIVRKFKKQHVTNLLRWAKKIGGLRFAVTNLDEEVNNARTSV